MQENRILSVLPRSIRVLIGKEHLQYEYLQEIKLRVEKPLLLVYRGEEIIPGNQRGKPYIVTREDIREMLEYISNYSLYAYEQEMKQGYITIEGGHRVGMTGQAIIENGKVKNLRYISSINLRMSHEILGCADPIFPFITYNKKLYHTLIVSPPRCGKTTLLRDMIRQISNGNGWINGMSVGVVDERSELGGCYMGVAQTQLGIRTDVLDCCPKAEGMIMLIRSMGPEVIAVDEIGTAEDVHAIEYAMHCGCKMLATVHADSMEELRKKPLFDQMVAEKRFERYVLLENREHVGQVEGIYDSRGTLLYRETLQVS
ncbi:MULTISPECIES: stage III sporulation protein AA [Lachnospiraceae]|uniref:stage III sporulation protein AA n=1 Tax=Lachnospiraceae TaxID=186803 RepID=UPI001F173B99|nr:stage III sporulation protein AA [Faecalicatena contorta]MCI6122214.1 stage III sporulation protein AA [Lachnospiraceae bacterium]MCF2667075.1 stage III sporulation protein AA [Faecalicatena contorta]MCI6535338.1 stage III sporulation protein AA [Lachnospiraceae bacterium]MDY2614545.1 stage III sporulation protein AA [Lachnospiraceae bacterium]MDY4206716.1 stage III sporulation protein AA [Lachnospiraceae bacterium]